MPAPRPRALPAPAPPATLTLTPYIPHCGPGFGLACPRLPGGHPAGLAPKAPLRDQGSVTVDATAAFRTGSCLTLTGSYSDGRPGLVPPPAPPRTLLGQGRQHPAPLPSQSRPQAEMTGSTRQSELRVPGTPLPPPGGPRQRPSLPASGSGQASAPDTTGQVPPKGPLGRDCWGERLPPQGWEEGPAEGPLAGTWPLPEPPHLPQCTQTLGSFGSSKLWARWLERPLQGPGPQP